MSEMVEDRISWAVEDGVARVALARPESGNALDAAMAQALLEAASRIAAGAATGDIRVAVLTARGRAFCVGGDLREFAAAADPAAHVARVAGTLHEAIVLLNEAAAPLVTVVQGTAAGGGVGLATAGDVVLAASGARLRLAYTGAGLSPDCGSSWLLAERLGLARALDLALTNRDLTGEQAEAWGLVSRSVDDADLDAEVERVVATLAGGSRPALAATKRLMRTARAHTLPEHLALEAATIAELLRDGEGREGMAAFLAKRAPTFA